MPFCFGDVIFEWPLVVLPRHFNHKDATLFKEAFISERVLFLEKGFC